MSDIPNESRLQTMQSEDNAKNSITMPMLEKMMGDNYVGSIELDDEQADIMTASYSEIYNKDFEGMSLNLDNFEQTGTTVGFSDEADLSTPVYEGIDPTQALLYEDRVSTFLSSGFENSCEESPQEEHLKEFVETTNEKHQNAGCSGNVDSPTHFEELYPRSLYLRPLKQPVPPIDPSVIFDLEAHARGMATSVDTLIENLTGTLHSISSLTVECVETYRDGVCKTCDSVDSNIKSMYQLMAKCEELSKAMSPIYKMSEQIKEIRRLLDLFESVVPSGGS